MRVPKWLPWIVGITIPAVYLAVTGIRSQPSGIADSAAPVTSPAPEKAVPNPDPRPRKTSEKVYGTGKDLRKVVYRLSDKGSPLTCDILDAEGVHLLKCRFGYDRKPGPQYGKVVEAQVFNAQKPPVPQAGKDTPLQRLIYTYDAAGAPGLPITINLEPTGIATRLLGSALVGFNPLIDSNAAPVPAAAR